MTRLQTPAYVYMNGALVEWNDATIHVGSEALIRGISVFEGIKGYWQHDGDQLNLLALRAHYDRLVRSAALQHLPFDMDFDAFSAACSLLVKELMVDGKDLWIRPTLLSVDGHWGEYTKTDLVITCYNQDMARPAPIDVGISTWQRAHDTALPTRIKSAANYQVGRLARIEGRRQGFSDMVLLNSAGRVSEATGSCVLVVRDGRVSTPPPYEGCLESITVDLVEALCESLDIPFERRPIDRTELLVADAVCLAGTLMELGRVRTLEHRQLPESAPELDRIAEAFWAAVRLERPHPALELTPV